MNIDDIRALARLVTESNLSEIEVEEKGMKIRIRGPHPVEVQTVANLLPPAVSASPLPPVAHAPEHHAPAAPAAAPKEDIPANMKKVISPMVGTFYRSPSPDSDPFVQVGDTVKPDTTVCIVEAMKLMNEIKAEAAGVIKKVMVENGQPVEFGQPMFLIEPA
jgi:acetyl-CoA carboxylase biotin carboxyl carrier protein